MSKRLTDTDKWKDEWFLSLSNDSRILWQYALDNCNHAGILEKSFNLMNFCCKTSVLEEQFKEIFRDKIIDCGKFFFIPNFIFFQQKINSINELNPLNKCHASIINILESENILSPLKAPKKGLARGYGKGIGKGIGKEHINNIERFLPMPEESRKEIDRILGRSKK